MSYPYKDLPDWERHKKKCRELAAIKCSDNICEQTRVRIVRIMRECECMESASARLGISATTIRKYLRFVPFEHLMRNPALENRFDWRSMTGQKWKKLLRKHPQFIRHLPKKTYLSCMDIADILIARPQLAPYFDLSGWNRLELGGIWQRLLSHRPQFADQCDFSVIKGLEAKYLLEKQPQFFERIPLETLWAYHWTELFHRQPQLEKKMLAKTHSEWPFNFWVHALQYHPELEPEFSDWNRIEDQDVPDFKRTQPEMYKRHWPEKCVK